MKHSSISGISVAGKKASPAAMAHILLVGLALLLPGMAALATIDPIPGVDIVVRKNPGGIAVSAPTGSDGTYKFTGLAAGNYDLSVGGQRVQTITVGANQGISGVLSSEPGGKASITFNGQVGVVPILPSAPVNTSRSDKKAGIAKGEKSPLPTTRETTTTTPINGWGGTGGGRLAFAGADGANSETEKTTIKQSTPASGIGSTYTTGDFTKPQMRALQPTAAPENNGDGKLPGNLRVINNSETETATVEAINGIGGTGGGRLTFKPISPVADPANAASSNRDHIDQDAQFDIKKRTDVQPGGPGNARIRVGADVSTLRVTESAPGPTGGDGKLPGLADQPMAGLDVKLEKNPGGSNEVTAHVNQSGGTIATETIAPSRTDSQGNFHFDKLPAGNYVLTLAGLPSQSLTVGDDGIAGGTVMRGPGGSIRIFDRWGIRTAASPKGGGNKAAEKPVGFGSGNTIGAGPGGMGPGPMSPGPTNPGAMGGAMAPGGAMGPGRAMGGAGMGRP